MSRLLLVLILVATATWGCVDAPVVSVGELRTNPAKYIDRSITVHGHLTHALTMPFLAAPVYLLDDGTGTIPVLIDRRPDADDGSVNMHGTLRAIAGFDSFALGLYVDARRPSLVVSHSDPSSLGAGTRPQTFVKRLRAIIPSGGLLIDVSSREQGT